MWLGVVALIGGAVVALRATDDREPAPEEPPPVTVERFAATNVVLPQPGPRPEPPARVVVTPDTDALRLSWAEALPGGTAPAGAAGYEVRWTSGGEWRTRLVASPELSLDGLRGRTRYRVEVRTVDAFGQRSGPVEVTGVTSRARTPWREGLTGLFDDFTDEGAVRQDRPGSRWRLSGYRGCVDPGPVGRRGLPIELSCGADVAVLRARRPMTLTGPLPSGELGRVAVRTDAAGHGGELTVDLVPGRADRVGEEIGRTDVDRDPALPGGTVRVAVGDGGARVIAAPDVPAAGPPPVDVYAAPRRGPGVPHLFEVVLTTSGVRVLQDGLVVAVGGFAPAWRSASVLLGFRGPGGRGSVVHLAAAGFTGPVTEAPRTAEVLVNAGTQRVMALEEEPPQLGIAREPLVAAASARMVATLAVTEELDPFGVVMQFGGVVVPAPPVVAVPARTSGAMLTVAADVPAALLGAAGADSITPFVLRARGATGEVRLTETYLEVTPGPGWRPTAPPSRSPRRTPPEDALPTVDAVLANSAGEPLTTAVVPGRGQVVLRVDLDAAASQWDTGSVGGVQGFQVWLDGSLIAGVPTRADGPGVGGRHAMSIAVGGLARDTHVLEVREYAMAGDERPVSVLLSLTVR